MTLWISSGMCSSSFDHYSISFSLIMTSSTCVDDLRYRIVAATVCVLSRSFTGLSRVSTEVIRRISSAFSESCSEHLLWVSHCRFRVGILGLPFGVRWRCLPTLGGVLGCLHSYTFGGSKT